MPEALTCESGRHLLTVFLLAGVAQYAAVLVFYDDVEALLARGLSAYPDYVHLRVEWIRLLSDPDAKRAAFPEQGIIALSKNSDLESGYFLGSIYASRSQCADAYNAFEGVFASNKTSPWDIDLILRADLYGDAAICPCHDSVKQA